MVFVSSVRNWGGAQTPACLVSSLIKKSLDGNKFMVTDSTSFYAKAFIADRRFFFHDILVMMNTILKTSKNEL